MTRKLSLTNEQFLELLKRSKKGDIKARNQILEANLGLIKKIASEVHLSDVEFDDLVEDGCEKFLEIINSYDPERCPYLSSYIWLPIRSHMYEKNRRVSRRLLEYHINYEKAKEELTKELDRDPRLDEIASYLGKDVNYIRRKNAEFLGSTEISHELLCNKYNEGDEKAISLLERSVSPYDTPAEAMEKLEELNFRKKAWNSLSDEEKQILKLRYNEEDGKKVLNLRDTAEIMGYTHQTVRNKELKAIKTLNSRMEEFYRA